MVNTRGACRVCSSMARILQCSSPRSAVGMSCVSRFRRPGDLRISGWVSGCTSASIRVARRASRAPAPPLRMREPRIQRRLILGLLLAPALLWLLALIILQHLDLALLSYRERSAPGVYQPSLAQYGTFFSEPLYWQVFLRTALLSAVANALTLLVAFPIAWVITKVARGRASSTLFILCLIPFWVSETVRSLGWLILRSEE